MQTIVSSRAHMSWRYMRPARLHTWSDQTRPADRRTPAVVLPAAPLPYPRVAAPWRRPAAAAATSPMRRGGRCGAASSRRSLRLLPLPPPAPSPGRYRAPPPLSVTRVRSSDPQTSTDSIRIVMLRPRWKLDLLAWCCCERNDRARSVGAD
jgi:hypothetical protein